MSGILGNYQPTFNIEDEQVKTPNMQAAPDPIQSTVNNAVQSAVSQKAAENTVISGLDSKKQVEAVKNTASDIQSGNKEPGFFSGIMSGIGTLLQQPTTQLLLSGLAGAAIGKEYGIGGTAGGIQGAMGGLQQIQAGQQREAGAKQQGLENLFKTRELDLREETLRLQKATKAGGSTVRRITDASALGQSYAQKVSALSPEDIKRSMKALITKQDFQALPEWEKTMIMKQISEKAYGGSLDRLFASIAETQ
jgi:hypothetical protein